MHRKLSRTQSMEKARKIINKAKIRVERNVKKQDRKFGSMLVGGTRQKI